MASMLDPKLSTLINRLLERTERGEITWHEGAVEGDYQLDFPRYSILLSEDKDFDANWITMSIRGSQGTVIDSVYEKDLRQEERTFQLGESLDKIHKLARRQALGVDQALDDLLKEVG